ncbi:MAG: PAS domain-containing sensor histidine kinase [Micavibrio sp.]|nr:MAG: PAS domain-containing sensor histidine kinase [Micavibrio sp.]
MSFISDHMPMKLPFLLHKRMKSRGRRSRVWQNRLAGALALAAIVSGFATYAALTDTPPFGDDPGMVIWLLNLDLIILLSLVGLIAKRLVSLWSGRKRKLAGSRLHVRLVYTFSVMAAVPVIIMTVFSAFFFHFGVQTWFSNRVQTAVNESQAVAQAYLEEHQQVIKADTLAMANDLDRQATLIISNNKAFEQIMQTQSVLRNLSEAIVFNADGRVLARAGLSFMLEFEEAPSYAIGEAAGGEVVLMTGGNDDRIRALVKLRSFADTYLFVGRTVDPQVLSHLAATRKAVEDYADLQTRYSGLQITVTMIFVVVGLLLLLAAIWYGLILARKLVTPISTLITTSDRVRAGDLTARVPEHEMLEEFDYLARSFNRMTKQIQEQQGELIQANRQLDQRRRFTETVLAGVSSGVLGVDEKNKINVANNSAVELLGRNASELTGKNIVKIMPEFKGILKQAHSRPGKITQAEITAGEKEGVKRSLLVRVAIELIGEEDKGAIITFDDITELQSAQRKAAWADVARRIAHEIKNPLTPIQLSAERLKRKYLGQIKDDPETFEQCTETIIKHVGDIGHMVNEFSSFARMPEPVMQEDDLGVHIRDALVLQQQAHLDIRFNLIGTEKDSVLTSFDAQQIRQAVTNIVQNAVDSIESRYEQDKGKNKKPTPGHIDILLSTDGDDEIAIVITDNGLGLPKNEDAARLSEPYVTHKPKGTGLGLAIVKKIMEDHGGRLVLSTPDWLQSLKGWQDRGGASVVLVLPRNHGGKARAA